jgi:hypothetical protein
MQHSVKEIANFLTEMLNVRQKLNLKKKFKL